MASPSNQSIKLKLTPFKGQECEWLNWRKTFIIRALVMGYKDYMEGNIKPEDTSEEEKLKCMIGYHDLLTECEDPVAFSYVEASTSKHFPHGCLHTAWTSLNAKYSASTGAQQVQLQRRFHQLKMNPTEDPELWVMKLEKINSQLNNKMDDQSMMIHIISSLPSEYESVTSLL